MRSADRVKPVEKRRAGKRAAHTERGCNADGHEYWYRIAVGIQNQVAVGVNQKQRHAVLICLLYEFVDDNPVFIEHLPVVVEQEFAVTLVVVRFVRGRPVRKIELRGGELEIAWADKNASIWMTGPAARVFTGEWPLEDA